MSEQEYAEQYALRFFLYMNDIMKNKRWKRYAPNQSKWVLFPKMKTINKHIEEFNQELKNGELDKFFDKIFK